jgi:hypothetical protein
VKTSRLPKLYMPLKCGLFFCHPTFLTDFCLSTSFLTPKRAFYAK